MRTDVRVPSLPMPLLAAFMLGVVLSAAGMPPAAAQGGGADHIPAELLPKLSELSREQLEFFRGPEPMRVMGSRAQLVRILEQRSPEQIEAFVADMMRVVEAFKYEEGVDMGEIPLNPEATAFNGHTVVIPEILKERRRDPGPFSLNRYVDEWGGIPTFAGAPVAITPEDLRVGRVDIAIAGIPVNFSSGRRDAQNGPGALRLMHGMADRDVYSMVDPASVLSIVDYGDISVDHLSVERSIDHVHDMVYEVIGTGAVPFLVGGDHSVMYPTVRAVRAAHPDEGLKVVHFGAHYNAERTRAHSLTDRDAIYRLLVEEVVDGSNLIQVGLRGPRLTPEALVWLREQGVRYHTMAEVERRGWPAVMERVIDEAKSGGERVYISFDVSVLDPSQLAAAGRAAPGGLTVRELTPLVRRLCAETEIAGFELMDLAPMLDLSYVSTMNANHMLNACLAGVAMRRSGLVSDHYLDAMSVDHGQP